MTHVVSRLTHETIERILTDPRSVNPKATMPVPALSHEERGSARRLSRRNEIAGNERRDLLMALAYPSQRVAYPYFVVALLLFVLQVIVGIWLALSYALTIPQWLVDLLPFSTTRAVHTNLLVLWLLLGFMGSTYFMAPEETEREIYSPTLAYIQLVLLVGTGVTALAGFLFGWTKGKPLLEIPFPLDYLVVVGALIFLFNVGMTILRARQWTVIQGSLFGGPGPDALLVCHPGGLRSRVSGGSGAGCG
jgi:nitric oxide reductase large subunit